MEGTHRTDETKRRIGDRNSVVIAQRYVDGGMAWSRGKYTSTKTNQTCYYRSSWELRHMQDLDRDDSISWWEHEPMRIPYVFEGKERNYVPDFIVRYADGRKEMQEVGRKTVKEGLPRNQAKIESARLFCESRGWTFRVVSF